MKHLEVNSMFRAIEFLGRVSNNGFVIFVVFMSIFILSAYLEGLL